MSTPLRPTGAGDSPAFPPDSQSAGTVDPQFGAPSQPDRREQAARRAFPRIPCRVLVDYVVDGRAFRDRIANISEGGAFIETSKRLLPGKPITLSFSLFQDQQPIKVAGEVAWCSGTGIGVKLHSNPGIRQFCAEDVTTTPMPPREAALHSLVTDEQSKDGEEDEEESLPEEDVAPVLAPPKAAPVRLAPPVRPAPPPVLPARDRRPIAIPTALPVWVAIILVTTLLLLDRSQTNSRILALTDKVDRTSQALARLEPRLAALASQTGGPRSVDAPVAVQIAQPAPPADLKPSAAAPEAAPATAVNATSPGQDVVYVVQQGDTLFRIARKFDVPSTMLVDVNHLSDPNIVLIGQRLRIPAARGM
jgi:LysM repeat protein